MKREYREFAAGFVPQPTSRVADVRWGIGTGLFFAAACSLYVIGVSLIVGPEAFIRYNLTLWQIVAVYTIAGVLSGALVGILRKYGERSPGRARVVGALVGPVGYGCFGIAMFGFTAFSIVAALVIGVPMGLFVTSRWQRRGMFDPLLPHRALELHQRWQEHQRAAKSKL